MCVKKKEYTVTFLTFCDRRRERPNNNTSDRHAISVRAGVTHPDGLARAADTKTTIRDPHDATH